MADYWNMNPKQLGKYLNAYKKRRIEKTKDIDLLNHALGVYIGIATNNPTQYPKEPYSLDIGGEKTMTDEEMEWQARKNTIRLGGVVK